jgi:hypothetical protein
MKPLTIKTDGTDSFIPWESAIHDLLKSAKIELSPTSPCALRVAMSSRDPKPVGKYQVPYTIARHDIENGRSIKETPVFKGIADFEITDLPKNKINKERPWLTKGVVASAVIQPEDAWNVHEKCRHAASYTAIEEIKDWISTYEHPLSDEKKDAILDIIDETIQRSIMNDDAAAEWCSEQVINNPEEYRR